MDSIEREAKRDMYPLIVNYMLKNQRAPTLHYMMAVLGYSSTSVTRDRVNKLVSAGWVNRSDEGYLTLPGLELRKTDFINNRLIHSERIKASEAIR